MKKLHSQQYKCIIRHFADGDTVYLLHECDHCFLWQANYIRLAGIESHELRSVEKQQALAIAATLTEKFKSVEGELYLKKSGSDKYGRLIGDVMIGGKLLSAMIVELGFAWYHDFKFNAKKKHESYIR